MTNEAEHPVISIGVEIKRSDGNYGSVTANMILSRIPAGFHPVELEALLDTGEVIYGAMRDRLEAQLNADIATVKWDDEAEAVLDEPPIEAYEPAPQPVRAVSAPSQAATQASRQGAAIQDPLCPMCNGKTWDNREKKASGDFSEKSPDFTCRDKECKADGEHRTAAWLTKDGGLKWNTGI